MSKGKEKTRHVLGISGGKDSAALAIYMREKVPEMEYFFSDTGAELPETYEFIERLEAFLGKPIVKLSAERNFDHFLKMHNDFLPSAKTRWCTRMMKIKPFEHWVGDSEVFTYIGIRADEDREGYISIKPNIKPKFPFKEDRLVKEDIFRILEESGVGVPEYYKWRSRSGCYFCFFQRKDEWVGLKENHPDLFEKAKTYEKFDPDTGRRYTWSEGESLEELSARATEIKARAENKLIHQSKVSWQEKLVQEEDDDQEEQACIICSL